MMGGTENEAIGQAAGNGVAGRCEEVRDEVGGGNVLLGEELTDQTVIRVGLVG